MTGTWRVIFLDKARFLNILRDRKAIAGDSGYNVAWGVKWGRFKVRFDVTNVYLDYGYMLDELVPVKENEYRGTAYWKGRELCKFRLVKETP
jgi:hypothetical protein